MHNCYWVGMHLPGKIPLVNADSELMDSESFVGVLLGGWYTDWLAELPQLWLFDTPLSSYSVTAGSRRNLPK